jgi:hypothetical protein
MILRHLMMARKLTCTGQNQIQLKLEEQERGKSNLSDYLPLLDLTPT